MLCKVIFFFIVLTVTSISGMELVEMFDIIDDSDCDDSGDVCIYHEECCGGCCYSGICINTYTSCMTAADVCRNHICMGAESCVVYVPPECPGCEPMPLCRIV